MLKLQIARLIKYWDCKKDEWVDDKQVVDIDLPFQPTAVQSLELVSKINDVGLSWYLGYMKSPLSELEYEEKKACLLAQIKMYGKQSYFRMEWSYVL